MKPVKIDPEWGIENNDYRLNFTDSPPLPSGFHPTFLNLPYYPLWGQSDMNFSFQLTHFPFTPFKVANSVLSSLTVML